MTGSECCRSVFSISEAPLGAAGESPYDARLTGEPKGAGETVRMNDGSDSAAVLIVLVAVLILIAVLVGVLGLVLIAVLVLVIHILVVHVAFLRYLYLRPCRYPSIPTIS